MSTRHDVTKRPDGFFQVVLEEAEPDDEIIYHVGEFASGPHKKAAYNAHLAKQCILYQRKREDGLFEYTARKKKP